MMDDEKLISLVKKKEEIYNRTHPLYRYQGCKKEAWEYIARKMDATGMYVCNNGVFKNKFILFRRGLFKEMDESERPFHP